MTSTFGKKPVRQFSLRSRTLQTGLRPRSVRPFGPLLHIIWRECLGTELRGTSFSADSMTISTGAVPAIEDLRTIREKSLAGLLEFYDRVPDTDGKQAILNSLFHAMRLPTQAVYSNDLCAMVLSDTKRIVEEVTKRVADMPYEVLQYVEHSLLYQYRRVRDITDAPDDRFGAGTSAKGSQRRSWNSGRLPTVLPASSDTRHCRLRVWCFQCNGRTRVPTSPKLNVTGGSGLPNTSAPCSHGTEQEWYATIERCAATKSNDMATFPLFGDFLVLLAKHKPEMAERSCSGRTKTYSTFWQLS